VILLSPLLRGDCEWCGSPDASDSGRSISGHRFVWYQFLVTSVAVDELRRPRFDLITHL